MKKTVALVMVAAVAGIAFYHWFNTDDFHSTGIANGRRSKTIPAEVSADCPIRAIAVGMTLSEVTRALHKVKLEDRGTRQDEDVYFARAKNCHAFLDFSDLDGKLDVIDYDLGFDKILFRENAPSALNTPAPKQTPTTTEKKASMGYPVPEAMFVNAYILANAGKDDLDNRQLEQLARDEYTMGQSIDTQTLLLTGSALNNRAWRAMQLIDSTSRNQTQDEDPSSSNDH